MDPSVRADQEADRKRSHSLYTKGEIIGQGAFGVVRRAQKREENVTTGKKNYVAFKEMRNVRVGHGISQDVYREIKVSNSRLGRTR